MQKKHKFWSWALWHFDTLCWTTPSKQGILQISAQGVCLLVALILGTALSLGFAPAPIERDFNFF
jgi:hypothetical protein